MGMVGSRKKVTICSNSAAFNGALRLMLDDYEVHVVSSLAEADPGSDVLVWRVAGELQAQQLAELAASVPTLVLADEKQLIRAVDAGVRGFLTDLESLDEIRGAVDTLLEGGALVPPDLLGTLLHHLVERRRREQVSHDSLTDLTERELEVFWLAVDGLRKEDIGERLFMSPATARTHLQSIYRKLGVHSQSELMALGMRIGESESRRTND